MHGSSSLVHIFEAETPVASGYLLTIPILYGFQSSLRPAPLETLAVGSITARGVPNHVSLKHDERK